MLLFSVRGVVSRGRVSEGEVCKEGAVMKTGRGGRVPIVKWRRVNGEVMRGWLSAGENLIIKSHFSVSSGKQWGLVVSERREASDRG